GEGYVDSAAIGLIAGSFAAAERLGNYLARPPQTTAHGALLAHITGGHVEPVCGAEPTAPRWYQPMNVNFGLFPPLAHAVKRESGQRLRGTEKALAKKRALTRRALADLERWITGADRAAAE